MVSKFQNCMLSYMQTIYARALSHWPLYSGLEWFHNDWIGQAPHWTTFVFITRYCFQLPLQYMLDQKDSRSNLCDPPPVARHSYTYWLIWVVFNIWIGQTLHCHWSNCVNALSFLHADNPRLSGYNCTITGQVPHVTRHSLIWSGLAFPMVSICIYHQMFLS